MVCVSIRDLAYQDQIGYDYMRGLLAILEAIKLCTCMRLVWVFNALSTWFGRIDKLAGDHFVHMLRSASVPGQTWQSVIAYGLLCGLPRCTLPCGFRSHTCKPGFMGPGPGPLGFGLGGTRVVGGGGGTRGQVKMQHKSKRNTIFNATQVQIITQG